MFSSWTDGAIARVAELLRQGKSASEIGADLGVARNAVIGKVHRTPMLSAIGFSRSPIGTLPTGAARTIPYRPAAIIKHVAKPAKEKKPDRAIIAKPIKSAAIEKKVLLDFVSPSRSEARLYDERSRRIPLADLAAQDCRWPVNDTAKGDGAAFLFCGLPSDDRHKYCLHHCLRALADGTEAKALLLDKAARQALQAA